MKKQGPPQAELEARLDYGFRDKTLLARALTHASAPALRGAARADAAGDNDTLEFLGDRVLGLIVAERLCALYPGDDAGLLTLRINHLVCGRSCALVAEALELWPHLAVGGSGGHNARARQAIQADACEALIAAVHLDGGLAAARRVVLKHWAPLFALASARPDAKTALQEWCLGHGGGLPVYRIVERRGPAHAPRFTVEVAASAPAAEPGIARGCGSSRRRAEQAAAARVLELLEESGADAAQP